ncbi:MAG: hypothetical protein IKS93_06355 [Methanobrevibacter sp.]|nr:hypothetical protein [Methanobrevibacter sp.]
MNGYERNADSINKVFSSKRNFDDVELQILFDNIVGGQDEMFFDWYSEKYGDLPWDNLKSIPKERIAEYVNENPDVLADMEYEIDLSYDDYASGNTLDKNVNDFLNSSWEIERSFVKNFPYKETRYIYDPNIIDEDTKTVTFEDYGDVDDMNERLDRFRKDVENAGYRLNIRNSRIIKSWFVGEPENLRENKYYRFLNPEDFDGYEFVKAGNDFYKNLVMSANWELVKVNANGYNTFVCVDTDKKLVRNPTERESFLLKAEPITEDVYQQMKQDYEKQSRSFLGVVPPAVIKDYLKGYKPVKSSVSIDDRLEKYISSDSFAERYGYDDYRIDKLVDMGFGYEDIEFKWDSPKIQRALKKIDKAYDESTNEYGDLPQDYLEWAANLINNSTLEQREYKDWLRAVYGNETGL